MPTFRKSTTLPRAIRSIQFIRDALILNGSFVTIGKSPNHQRNFRIAAEIGDFARRIESVERDLEVIGDDESYNRCPW